MNELLQRAIKYLQARFPMAVVANQIQQLRTADGRIEKEFGVLVAYDTESAVKQAMIALPNAGINGDVALLAREFRPLLTTFKASFGISGGNALEGDLVADHQMVDSPRVIVYTDSLQTPREDILKLFNENGWVASIVDESSLFLSALVSFGGPDEAPAKALNSYLKSCGITTWFFPNDAVPGDKLHRTMSLAVGKYDRTILLCSKASLDRPGVQNELERVLEREAREGGASLLIPVSIDRYVFDEWNPKDRDRAEQLRTRVIMTFPENWQDRSTLVAACEPLLKALRRTRTW